MKHLVLASTITLLIAGCSPELLKLMPGSTTPPQSGEDCLVVKEIAAPMFYVDAPATASAGATVSIEPWVLLEAPVAKMDELIPGTFKAEVDLQAKTVTVRGMTRRYQPKPNANCAFPAIYIFPKAATLSLSVVLPAGEYVVAIATESYTTEKPPSMQHPNEPEKVYPGPQATRSLIVE